MKALGLGRGGSRFVIGATTLSLAVAAGIFVISQLVQPLLPREFELLDFLSELAAIVFALALLGILNDVASIQDRIAIGAGVLFFALGAAADTLDEFGLGGRPRMIVENLAVVIGMTLVAVGLRDWTAVHRGRHAAEMERHSFLAYHDALTGLRNRVALVEIVDLLITQADRRKDQVLLALLYMDLDRFKSINDTEGHTFGDMVLKETAHRLTANTRASDVCFRLGGDEFVVLAPNLRHETDAFRIAEKLQDAFETELLVGDRKVRIGLSVGIALFPRDGGDLEELLRRADLAMYSAKAGDKRIRFFTSELSDLAVSRVRLEASLRRAIEDDNFVLEYQPIVDPAGTPVSYEALLRLDDPSLGRIMPSRFIPVAEESDLMVPVGRWVLRRACEDMARFSRRIGKPVSVAINVSAVQLADEEFVQDVQTALRDSGLDPERLTIEITESAFMPHVDDVARVIRSLQGEGVRFAVDDFGSGWSSLSYLLHLPVSTIKFDKSLLDGVRGDETDVLLPGLVQLIKQIGKSPVIEGVEDGRQLSLFAAIAELQFQGFHFGRPAPIDKIET